MKRLLTIFFVLTCVFLLAQNGTVKTIDSLKQKLAAANRDSTRIGLLRKLSLQYDRSDSGVHYISMALDIAHRLKDRQKVASCLSTLGYFYLNLEKKSEALRCYKEALQISEEIKDRVRLSATCMDLGVLFTRMEKLDLAKEYLEKGLAIDIEMKDTLRTAEKYTNLANISLRSKDYHTALQHYQSAVAVFTKFNDLESLAIANGNIGSTYEMMGQPERAVHYYLLSLEAAAKNNSWEQQVSMLYNLGHLAYLKKDYPVSIGYFKRGLGLCDKPESLSSQIVLSELLWGAYYSLNQIDSAFNYLYMHAQLKDSLSKISNAKQLNELSVAFETEKKEKQIQIQQLSLDKQQEELKRKKAILYSVAGGLMLALVLGYFMYRSLQKNKRQNRIIAEQKKQVDKAYSQLHEKNKEVIDSIYYAQRIQNSILPSQKRIEKELERVRGNGARPENIQASTKKN